MRGERLEVLGDPVAVGLAALGHRVGHEDPGRRRARHRLGHAGNDERCQQARIEAARPEDQRVGLAQGLEHDGRRHRGGRVDTDALDRRAASRNRRLAVDRAPVRELGDQVHPLRGGGQDEIVHAQELGGELDRGQPVGRDHVERRQQQIPDRVLRVAPIEPVLERRRHLRRDAGERQETVADVSGRDHAVLLSQGSRASAVVGGRHDRRDPVARCEMAAQRREHNREPGPAADRDDPHEFSPLRCHERVRP